MDVILHLGAHRTGSSSFQNYMTRFGSDQVAFWGPRVTRGGLFDGVHGCGVGTRPRIRAKGRIAVQLARVAASGAKALVISDANMIGALRTNLRCATLYPDVGTRMARLCDAFGGRISRVSIQIRTLDSYWTSALAFGLMRGIAQPDAAFRARLVASDRRWRDVITELACAVPDVPIIVTAFEHHVQRPDQLADLLTGCRMAPMPAQGIWTNRHPDARRVRACLDMLDIPNADALFDPDGQWQPFSPTHRQTQRARTAADLAWLRAGAEGLAHFQDHQAFDPAIRAGQRQTHIRGSEDNDSQNRHMARPC